MPLHRKAKLKEKEAGFRLGSSNIEQLLEYLRLLVIIYVDFRKTFDSVYHPILWNIYWEHKAFCKVTLISLRNYILIPSVKTGSSTTDYLKVAEFRVQKGASPIFIPCSTELYDGKINDSTMLGNIFPGRNLANFSG